MGYNHLYFYNASLENGMSCAIGFGLDTEYEDPYDNNISNEEVFLSLQKRIINADKGVLLGELDLVNADGSFTKDLTNEEVTSIRLELLQQVNDLHNSKPILEYIEHSDTYETDLEMVKLDDLSEEWQNFCNLNGLKQLSADEQICELYAMRDLIMQQIKYTSHFIQRWENAEDAIDYLESNKR